MDEPVARRADRVVIVDDHALFAQSLSLALTMEQRCEVEHVAIGDQMTTPALLSQVLSRKPRVVLLDLNLGRLGDATGLIRPLATAGVNVVVVTSTTETARWGACVRAGARKVLVKQASLQEIGAVVRRLLQGLPVMDVAERERLVEAYRERREHLELAGARLGLLTQRERDVLGLLMEGRTVREIAALGVVSEATVRTQVKSILAKLEVSSQIAAVGLAHSVGWHVD